MDINEKLRARKQLKNRRQRNFLNKFKRKNLIEGQTQETDKPQGKDIYKEVLEEAGIEQKNEETKKEGKRDKRTFNKHLDHLKEKRVKEISKKKQERKQQEKELKY